MTAMLCHIFKRSWPSVPRGHSGAVGYMVSIDAGRKSMPPFIQCASQEMLR